MNRLLTAGLLLLFACSAHAGGNPNVRAYIDFDPPNYVHAISPALYATVEAYLCLDNVEEGVTSISFTMQRPDEACPGVFIGGNWQDFFPSGGVIPMNPWPWGVTVYSTECLTSDPLVVGVVTTFYLGGSCCLEILDHPEYPRWVCDCSDPADVDQYCVLAHGSVGGADCPPGDCDPVPVEGSTWGTIKALYR